MLPKHAFESDAAAAHANVRPQVTRSENVS